MDVKKQENQGSVVPQPTGAGSELQHEASGPRLLRHRVRQSGYEEGASALSPRARGASTLLAPPPIVYGDSGVYGVGGQQDAGWQPEKHGGGSYQWTQATGLGRGTRAADNLQEVVDDQGQPTGEQSRKNGTVALSAGPRFGNRDMLPTNDSNMVSVVGPDGQVGEQKGNGAYTRTFSGSAQSAEFGPKASTDNTGASSLDIGSAKGVVGAGAATGWRANAKHASGSNAGIDISSNAAAGASYGVSANSSGITAEAAASAEANLVEVKANADAMYQWGVAGVSSPVSVGAGVNGEVRVGANAGASGKVGLSKDFIGAKGQLGAFAGVEAKADVHGNLGPLGGKAEASFLAGAGIGADGEFCYENGKIRIGAKAWAALGYGASVGGSVEIDLKQAVELGIVTAKKAKELADRDKDGRLTLNDPATAVSDGMVGGAAAIDKATRNTLAAIDADGDGKLTMADASQHVGAAKDAVVAKGKQVLRAGHDVLDADNDGQLGMGDVTAVAQAVGRAGQSVVTKAQQVGEYVLEEAGQLRDAVDQGIGDAKQALVAAGQKAHAVVDHDGDGHVELTDLMAHGRDARDAVVQKGGELLDAGVQKAADVRDAVVQKGGELVDAGLQKAGEARDALVAGGQRAAKATHDAIDVNDDGHIDLGDAKAALDASRDKALEVAESVKAGAEKAVERTKDALDVNNDGRIDAADASAAGKAAIEKARQARQAVKQQVVATYQRSVQVASETIEAGKAKLKQTGQVVHAALDQNGDGKLGLGDVKAAGSKAKQVVVQKAVAAKDAVVQTGQAVYKEASAQFQKAGATVASGYTKAKETLQGTWSTFKSYLPW